MAEALDVCAVGHDPDGWPVWAMLTNDEVLPVKNWHDDDGDPLEKSEGEYPAWLVAGPSAEGYWFTIDLADFTEVVAVIN